VLDADTDRPISGAVVAASWAFERGIGLQAPLAAREVVVESGVDGRYAIPRLTDLPDADVPGGASTRLRRFTLVVYRRGHVAWRSDRRFGQVAAPRRRDFSQRGNRVRLEKWQPGFRHAEHLVFLGGGEKVRAAAAWELQPAAMELEGEAGDRADKGAPGGEGAARARRAPLLDIEHLLSDDEVRGVTGFVGKFEDGKLTDLPTTEFYDSRHFKAVGKPEGYDVGLRVWRLGPAAAEAHQRELTELTGKLRDQLQSLAGISVAEARTQFLKEIESEAMRDASKLSRLIMDEAKAAKRLADATTRSRRSRE